MKKTTKLKITPFPDFTTIIPQIPHMLFKEIQKDFIEKIYLFGSYAYGQPNEYSDVDICVIIRDYVDRPYMQVKMKTILHNNNVVPSDLLVYNAHYFYEGLKYHNIERTIANKGKLLYGE